MSKIRGALVVAAVAGLMALLGATAQAAHSDYGCHGCHVPHKAARPDEGAGIYGVPLWAPDRAHDLPVFTLYSSATFDAMLVEDYTQPDGPSKLCLGCHDGSYVVFSYIPDSEAIFEEGGDMDLANSHPVSFTYDSALASRHPEGELMDPAVAQSGLGGTIAEDLLDEKGKMQCTSCHDVHTSGFGDYLLRIDTGQENDDDQLLCRVCHAK